MQPISTTTLDDQVYCATILNQLETICKKDKRLVLSTILEDTS